jgi:cytochrome c oxidase subunit 2
MLDWLPEDISSYGHGIDSTLYLIYYVVGVWFILAEGILLWFVFRYRKKEGEKASYVTGRSLKACMVILIPAALVLTCDLIIDVHGTPTWTEIKQEIPEADLVVKVEARQFAWNFRYPGPDGTFDTADDFITNGQLHVPVDKVIRLELESLDVIHSLWVPVLRFKQDIVPGRTIPAWFKATKTGSYMLACAELCGTGHGIMQGMVYIHANNGDDSFDNWMNWQQ